MFVQSDTQWERDQPSFGYVNTYQAVLSSRKNRNKNLVE